jgi:hypothetical protein
LVRTILEAQYLEYAYSCMTVGKVAVVSTYYNYFIFIFNVK